MWKLFQHDCVSTHKGSEHKSRFKPRMTRFLVWGAHASRVLVVAARDDELSLSEVRERGTPSPAPGGAGALPGTEAIEVNRPTYRQTAFAEAESVDVFERNSQTAPLRRGSYSPFETCPRASGGARRHRGRSERGRSQRFAAASRART
jgi:hypothetical protein